MDNDQEKPLRRQFPLGFALCVVLAGAVRCLGLANPGFSHAELQSASHSVQNVPGMMDTLARHDPHPPLYYLQLHYWMRTAHTETWVRLNSVMWSLLALAVVYFVSARVFSKRTAFFAAALFAVAPLAVFYAQHARMYAMMMFLAVVAWAGLRGFMCSEKRALAAAGGVISALACVAMGYAQGAGFLIFFATTVYAGVHAFLSRTRWKRFFAWCGVQALACAALLPWLLKARKQPVPHASAPSPYELAEALFKILFGIQGRLKDMQELVLVLALVAAVLGALSLCLLWRVRDRESVALFLGFIGAPIVATALISYWVAPIWLERTFAWVCPFVCIVLACMAGPANGAGRNERKTSKLGLATVSAFVILFALLSVRQAAHPLDDGYREAVAYLKEHAAAEDVIVARGQAEWCIAWYYAGPAFVREAQERDALAAIKADAGPEAMKQGQTYWLFQWRTFGEFEDFQDAIQAGRVSLLERLEFGNSGLSKVRLH